MHNTILPCVNGENTEKKTEHEKNNAKPTVTIINKKCHLHKITAALFNGSS